MPNRILREGILTSERVNSLNWEAEVFYRRLMSVVDDFGRFTAHPSLLRAALYPLKLDTVRDANMERLLALVEQARLVRVYEVAGKRYLELLDFKQQVRAKDSKYPQPPSDAQQMLSTCEADAHLDEGGDEDEGDTPQPPKGAFETFWELWPAHPRKAAKQQCADKWAKKGCDDIADAVIQSLIAWKQSEDWAKDRGQYIPAPLVWLNQGRWEARPTKRAGSGAVMTVISTDADVTKERLQQQERHAAESTPAPAPIKAVMDSLRQQLKAKA